MKSIVSFLAVVSQRIPWVVVAVTLVLTGVLGALAGQIEPATGNEGFAPEGEEISASERIGEKFGSEVSESTVQIVMRDDGGDVITLEGLRVATEVVQVVMGSDVGGNIADRPERPGIFHYLSGVEGAMAAQGLTIDQMTDEMVKSRLPVFFTGTDTVSTSPSVIVGNSDMMLGSIIVKEENGGGSDNTALYLGIGAVAIIAVAGIAILLWRRKK